MKIYKVAKFFYLIAKAKFIWTTPKNIKFILFDKFSYKISKPLGLNKNNSLIIDVRNESFYIKVLINLFFKFGFHFGKKEYFEEIFRIVKPKIVFTFIDNNILFYKFKKENPEIKFISIQNGMRNRNFIHILKKTKESLSVDYFFVFNENDKKIISKYIKSKYLIIGNLLNNHFYKESLFSKNSITYIMSGTNNTDYKKDLNFAKNIQNICLKNNLHFKILLRSNQNIIEHKKIFNSKTEIKKFKNFELTYRFLNNEKMLVFTHSTLGYEGMSKGIKCFILNKYFPIKNFAKVFNKTGFFWTDKTNKKTIEKNLLKIYNMKKKTWNSKTKKIIREIMYYDKKNKLIFKVLNKIDVALH